MRRILTVPDDLAAIEEALREALERKPAWIVMTGGLGPTYDDVTLQGVAAALGVPLVEDNRAREMIVRRLKEMKEAGRLDDATLTPERAKMARLPEGSSPLSNPAGTAPGALVRSGDSWVVCLPGVPAEMKAVFLEHVAPRMAVGRLSTMTVEVEVWGQPEASMAPLLKELAEKYQSTYVKSHPKGFEGRSRVLVQLTGRGRVGVDEVMAAKGELLEYLNSKGAEYKVLENPDSG